jgi:DNA-binding transcriptional LysR family regulator
MAFDLDHVADLALYARVVEHRSFSEAARRSGIAKSAVSRRIALLEARVGVQLLRRTTRSLHVTAEGARFYVHCAQILASARAAEDEIAGADTRLRGRVRISAPVTFGQMHLAAVLAAFQLEHPDVELQLVTDDRLVDVVGAGFDLVLRIARLKDASFVAKRLAKDRLVVVGSPAYLQRVGRPTTPEDLVHHNCLHYDLVPLPAEWKFRGADRRSMLAVKGNFTATDGTVLREAAIAGLGLAVLPLFMVSAEVHAGRLELVLDGVRRAEIGIYAVVSATRGLPLRVRTLLEFLVRAFARADWRDRAGSRL